MDATTGVPAVDALLVWGGALSLLIGLGTAVWRIVRAVTRVTNRTGQFLDDWYGELSRPGVPARPGVMERLANVETYVRSVHHEVKPNSGASLRDAVDRADARLQRLCPDVVGLCDEQHEAESPGQLPGPPVLPSQPDPPDEPSGH